MERAASYSCFDNLTEVRPFITFLVVWLVFCYITSGIYNSVEPTSNPLQPVPSPHKRSAMSFENRNYSFSSCHGCLTDSVCSLLSFKPSIWDCTSPPLHIPVGESPSTLLSPVRHLRPRFMDLIISILLVAGSTLVSRCRLLAEYYNVQ